MKVAKITEVDVAGPEELAALHARINETNANVDEVNARVDATDFIVTDLAARIEALENAVPPIPPPDLGVNTIFFDDFSAPEDAGWVAIPTAVVDRVNKPSRWDYYRCVNSDQYFQAGAGRDGGSAYVIDLAWPHAQVEIGSLGVQFPETLHLHLRTWVKLSEGFQYGSPDWVGSLFWKWYRLHQSPWTGGITPPQGVNGEDNTNYIVGTTTQAYFDHCCCWRTQELGSSGGPSVVYKNRPPNLDDPNPWRIPFGDYDLATWRFWNCDWVQIDITHRLGDVDQDNGDLIIWINGVKMSPPYNTQQGNYGGQPPVNDGKLCTNPRSHRGNPPGWNSFSFFDNHANMTLTWDKQHSFYCDSIYLFDGIPNDLAL